MVWLRGFSLADPTVVGWLQPFIVTSWASFRLEDAPEAVREHISRDDFGPLAKGGPRSNMKALVFDEKGKMVYAFDPLPSLQNVMESWEKDLPRHLTSEIRKALAKLGRRSSPPNLRQPRLPNLEDIGAKRAIRIFSGLEKKRTAAYHVPFVEIQEISEREWDTLAYPKKTGTVSASILKSSFTHVYPPGQMDRAQAGSGERTAIRTLGGELILTPAGSKGKVRFAILRGKVEMIYGGRVRFSYEGEFQAVLTYGEKGSSVQSMVGVFEADYPQGRNGRRGQRSRVSGDIPFAAVFETLSLEKKKKEGDAPK